ncbi:hypothetical protein IG193_06620 [Infirmifilum lucidum]|uniref:Uncharacterized protein n=1 Tax=Infirmifilum lucidum TaxID=2776706 RepID=A0A7L9FHP8_9CREN|nr:hypothetical protein [Infirmifilum lucidum]QOJ78424.1 hypothetical protein IG193_06620 [Infirmifilum lucidum]
MAIRKGILIALSLGMLCSAGAYDLYSIPIAWGLMWVFSLLLATIVTLRIVAKLVSSVSRSPASRAQGDEYQGLVFEVEEALGKGQEPSLQALRRRVFSVTQ